MWLVDSGTTLLTDPLLTDRLIHLRTQYLGPEEMLVGAKIALAPTTDLATVAATIDAAEVAIRAAVPAAQVIYLEPDLDRALTR